MSHSFIIGLDDSGHRCYVVNYFIRQRKILLPRTIESKKEKTN